MTQSQLITGYFDYNATTPVSDGVARVMVSSIDLFANPSGVNKYSASNKTLLDTSRKNVAKLLGTEAEKVFFTSGGSEANNWAIKGTLLNYFRSPGHIITTAIEHPSVLNTIKYYADKFGFEVTYIAPKSTGAIEATEVLNAIRSDTRLISIMYANNETGVLQPVEAVAQVAREKNIKFHVDAVQVIGKRRINVEKIGVDYLSFSGHKFYGPKGIGGLYIRDVENEGIAPLIHGGGQEANMRSGTENLIAIAGLSQASEEVDLNIDQWDSQCWACKKYLIDLLNESCIDLRFNGLTDYDDSISNTLNIYISGVRAEALSALMEVKYGIVVAIGSACSNNKTKKLSHVLGAMGMSEQEIQGSIRISFGRFTSLEDIEKFVFALEVCANQLLEMNYVA